MLPELKKMSESPIIECVASPMIRSSTPNDEKSTPAPTGAPPASTAPPVNTKRSSFSISNLLAPESAECKVLQQPPPPTPTLTPTPTPDVSLVKGRATSELAADEVHTADPTPNGGKPAAAVAAAAAYSPFLNASALAHLAHLHGSPCWTDWLGGNADPQTLWSRSAYLHLICIISG
jgi:hypothetical protein